MIRPASNEIVLRTSGTGGPCQENSGRDAEPVLSIQGICKAFGQTRALEKVSLSIGVGEVHGLVGQNGCGKSTLIKVLSGFHAPDEGRIELHGEPMDLPVDSPAAQKRGLSFVHQDLGIFPKLTVTENLFLAEVTTQRARFRTRRRDSERAMKVFESYSIDLDPKATVGNLTMARRAQLATIRALEQTRVTGAAERSRPGVLVLDEATASLSGREVDDLFTLVRRAVAQGTSVLFVSHHIDEVLELTDMVTILRDGRVIQSGQTGDFTMDSMVEAIVGEGVSTTRISKGNKGSGERLAAICALESNVAHNVSFEIKRGEIVGLAGLAGAGWEDIVPAIFGAASADAGTLILEDQSHDLRRMTPSVAVDLKLAYVPEDRKTEGGYQELSVTENLLSGVLPEYSAGGYLMRRMMRRESAALNRKFGVSPLDPGLRLDALSGGNQQKVIVAKWLRCKPKLLLLQDPTSGVDVGARASILELVRHAADEGAGVLCASSDFSELAQLCDRVLVFVDGAVSSSLLHDELSEGSITRASYGKAS